MAIIRPFHALRYTPAAGPLDLLVAPPYDVIDPQEKARLAASHVANAVHLILPVGQEPYRVAADLLRNWRQRGWLMIDHEPAVFVYAQQFSVHARSFERFGVFVALRLESLDDGIVLPHERTLAAPKADRLNLIRACRTNLSPIFGLVDAPLALSSSTDGGERLASFTDTAGVTHTLWRVTEPSVAADLVRQLAGEQVFIADGHHRYEISLAFRDEVRASEGNPPEPKPYDFVLAHLSSTRDPGLVVLPTHRCLRGAPDQEALLATWRAGCHITVLDDPEQLLGALGAANTGRVPRVGVVRAGSAGCWLLEASGADGPLAQVPEELRSLDVLFLHQVVLPGIAADRFTYTHDDREALHVVQQGEADLAAILPPPSIDDVLAISRAGLTMPQKSTYFHPKVPTGLVFHSLDD